MVKNIIKLESELEEQKLSNISIPEWSLKDISCWKNN